MGDWALRDIGRATTQVYLGFINLADIDDKYTYQEFPMSSLETNQGSDQIKMYPAEKWTTHFESFCSNWESVPQIDAYKLITNPDPDAPRQTLIYGYLSKGGGDIPNLIAADDNYCPPDSSYVVTTGGTTTTTTTTTGVSQSFAPPVDPTGGSGMLVVPALSGFIKDRPFIPSSIDHLAPDATIYKKNIEQNGIKIHNIWNVAYSSNAPTIGYIKNKGPYWGSAAYAGPTAEQVGEPGALRVKVNANKGAMTLYRVAPINNDIGMDSDYPWVFPYVDDTGSVIHGAMYNTNADGYFLNEKRISGGKPSPQCINVGFQMKVDVSAEGPRGAFANTGGGVSPNVTIAWGWPTIDKAVYPSSDGGFATSFYVTAAHNKIPILKYHDGTRIVEVQLGDSPADFTESTSLSLVVEYLGTAILVKTNYGTKLIKAESGMGGSSALKGVWVSNSTVSIYVAGCVATFDFSPVYYNPWSPSSDIKIGDYTNIEITTQDGGYHTANDLSFNPSIPETGFAKLIAASCFNTYAKPSVSKKVLDEIFNQMVSSFNKQTYTPSDLIASAINPSNTNNRFSPESGWPQCILDSREKRIDGYEVFKPIAKVYNYGSGVFSGSNSQNGLPQWAPTDPISTLSVVWQARTTCTTPLIFGFKIDDYPLIEFPEAENKDISQYVSKWEINWSAENDYKVLRAKGSVTLLNPPGYIIDVVSKNRMHIKIMESGYKTYSQHVDTSLQPFLYRGGSLGQLFTGLTVGTSLSLGPGGDVYFTIECVDPLKFLEDYRLETNLRFDGVSYFMAFSSLIQASDYAKMFIVEDQINYNTQLGGWRHSWRQYPFTVFPYSNAPITWDKIYSDANYVYNSMFFGYQPMVGRSYEVQAGSQLFDSLMEIMKNMHNPAALPLFFFRPQQGQFVLQIRNGDPNLPDMNQFIRPWFKSELSTEDDLKTYLPLLCIGNSEAYQITSDTSNLVSHFTVTGQDRATGLAIKATAINPKWTALNGQSLQQYRQDWQPAGALSTSSPIASNFSGTTGHDKSLSKIYGHIGYKKRAYQNVGNFVSNMSGAYAYAVSRCWWLMRPVITINNLTVYGIVDFYPDGICTIELGDTKYNKALLKQSTITYDANDGLITSRFSVFLFPPWSM